MAGVRTVVVTRSFAGASKLHFTFAPTTSAATMPFITAVGQTQTFAYHKAHHGATLTTLAPVGQPTCLCDTGKFGELCHNGGRKCANFVKKCAPKWDGQPTHSGGDLLTPQHNPTCNTMQYGGGLSCCGHKRVMLDADQDPGPSLLRYHMKFRFWFQEYQPGTPVRGEYVYRSGALPRGDDAMPAAVMTVEKALTVCTASKNCTGVTFAAADRKAAGEAVKVFFKNGTTLTNGAPGWNSYVVDAHPSHHHLPRFYYQTESFAGEYDIPPAFRRAATADRPADPPIVGYPDLPISTPGNLHLTPGTTCKGDCPDGPDCACVHTITYHWTMSNAQMLYAGGHCHAPSCIDIELYRNDTGTPELLCRQASYYGQGHVDKDRFDEAGYVVLPP